MGEKKKNKTIILCEGASDLAFISLFLTNQYNFLHTMNSTFHVKAMKSEQSDNYVNEKHEVIIFAVGGKDRFNDVFEEYIHPYITGINGENGLNLITIIDADENKTANIESLKFKNIKLASNKREENEFMNQYKEKTYIINSFLKVIPENESGALEDMLIKSLATSHPYITEESCKFVDCLDKNEIEHLKKKKMISKTKVGTIFNVIDPQKTFSSLKEKFMIVDLSTENILKTFKFFADVFEV